MVGWKFVEFDDVCLLFDGSGGGWFNYWCNYERDGKLFVERCDIGGVRYIGSEGNFCWVLW